MSRPASKQHCQFIRTLRRRRMSMGLWLSRRCVALRWAVSPRGNAIRIYASLIRRMSRLCSMPARRCAPHDTTILVRAYGYQLKSILNTFSYLAVLKVVTEETEYSGRL